MLIAIRRRPLAPVMDGTSAGVGPAASVLDHDALQRLRELDPNGQSRLLERVAQAFETSVDRLMPDLRNAWQSGDLQGVRHVAHTLKSSSASIGAIKLSTLCAEIESMIRLESRDGLAARVESMDRETAVVLQALRHLTDDSSP
jgi:HPt (histidine-containing phosphotransfer) domain-containing protein